MHAWRRLTKFGLDDDSPGRMLHAARLVGAGSLISSAVEKIWAGSRVRRRGGDRSLRCICGRASLVGGRVGAEKLKGRAQVSGPRWPARPALQPSRA